MNCTCDEAVEGTTQQGELLIQEVEMKRKDRREEIGAKEK